MEYPTKGSFTVLEIIDQTQPPLNGDCEIAISRCRELAKECDLVTWVVADTTGHGNIVCRTPTDWEFPKMADGVEADKFAHRSVMIVGNFTIFLMAKLGQYLKEYYACPQLFTSRDCSCIYDPAGEVIDTFEELMVERPMKKIGGPTAFGLGPDRIELPIRRLYWVNGSVMSWRVMIALYEFQLPFESHRIRRTAEHDPTQESDYLALNPRGRTPTLVDTNGTVAVESIAILEYLQELYGTVMPLLPKDLPGRARVRARMQEAEQLRRIYWPLEAMRQPVVKIDPKLKPTLIAAADQLQVELFYWEEQLTKNRYAAGQMFTLADCTLFPLIAYFVHHGIDLRRFEKLNDYYDRLSNRQSVDESWPVLWRRRTGTDIFRRIGELF